MFSFYQSFFCLNCIEKSKKKPRFLTLYFIVFLFEFLNEDYANLLNVFGGENKASKKMNCGSKNWKKTSQINAANIKKGINRIVIYFQKNKKINKKNAINWSVDFVLVANDEKVKKIYIFLVIILC